MADKRRVPNAKKMFFELVEVIDRAIKEYEVTYQDAAVVVMRAEDYLRHKEAYEMGYGKDFDRNNIKKREYKPFEGQNETK